MPSMAPDSHKQRMSDKVVKQLNLAYIYMDDDFIVTEVSENIQSLGFPKIPLGEEISDHIDFMIGVDSSSSLSLPAVNSPYGNPVSINLMEDDNGHVLVIGDASFSSEQRQILQQQANDNELLLKQQQKMSAQLKEAGRLQSSFLSGVSHEFRTPLSSIIGYTNLLDRQVKLIAEQAPDAVDCLSAIRRSSTHLLSLVENLLDHGKADSGELVINPKPTRLMEVFEDILILLKPLATTKNIDFNFTSTITNDDYVLIDASRTRQCLINIISNAIKFTDQGSVTLDAELNQDDLKVSVTDTGIGISEKDLSKVLLPFWQAADTGKVGTGLGLTITKRIIELMGGGMRIQSEPNKGTNVFFTISAPKHDPLDAKTLVLPKENYKILLAEDDQDIADFIIVLLEEKGIDVTQVTNGALAVEILERSDFDMVLMDLHMPVLNGYEAIKKIRGDGSITPIVVMSATPMESEENKSKQLECDAYLVKPVDVEDIILLAHELST